MKTMRLLAVAVAVLGFTGIAWAGHIWTGAATDLDGNPLPYWAEGANWDKGWAPFTSDDCTINAGSPNNGPVVAWSDYWQTNFGGQGSRKIVLGSGSAPVSMTIDNVDPISGAEGHFWVGVRGGTQAEIIMSDGASANSTLTQEGGYTDISHTLRVGNKGQATVHMNGGTLDIQIELSVPHNDGLPGGSYPNSEGTLYLDGGLIRCQDFSMKSATDKGHVYITDGVLTIERVRAWNFDTGAMDSYVDNSTPGAVAAYVQNLVDAGYIVASNPGDEIVIESTTTGGHFNLGWTTIYAVPEPVSLVLLGLGGLMLVRRRAH